MDVVVWIIGIAVGLIVVIAVLALALRGMRPKLPEPQVYTPTPSTPRTAPSSAAPATAATLTPDVVAEIDRLVHAGQKIQAVKLYRDRTGVGLKEAKDRIDHWSASTTAPHAAAVTHAAAAHSSMPLTPSSVRATLPAAVAAEIDALVAADARVAAIKALREATGLGLKESKNLIDAWTLPRG